MILNESTELTNHLKSTMKELDEKLDIYGYDYDGKIDLIYEFLMTSDSHFLDGLFQYSDIFKSDKIDVYKGMLILMLSTDFYVDIDYRINNNKICVDYQDEILKELYNQHTYKQIIFFFRNPYNEDYVKTIINHFYMYVYKDPIYINKCMNNVLATHKAFKLSIMNPLFNLDNDQKDNLDVIEPEVIKSEVFDLYDDLDLAQTQRRLEDEVDENEVDENEVETEPCYLTIVYPNVNGSLFVNLKNDEELEPLFIELKQKVIEQFHLKYQQQDKFNEAIAYMVSNAYESMKLNSNDNKEDYSVIISYFENNCPSIEQIVNMFVQDDGFSNCILHEFVTNNKLVKEAEIISRRKKIEDLGFAKILKKYNKFYEIEDIKYGGSKDGETFQNN